MRGRGGKAQRTGGQPWQGVPKALVDVKNGGKLVVQDWTGPMGTGDRFRLLAAEMMSLANIWQPGSEKVAGRTPLMVVAQYALTAALQRMIWFVMVAFVFLAVGRKPESSSARTALQEGLRQGQRREDTRPLHWKPHW